MGMNIEILKESFEAIKPVASKVVDHFYEVLFADHPDAKSLFKMDRMDKQKTALIHSLVTIFENLENPDKLKSYLSSMGVRHVKYGAKSEHYDWVAESLLKTLKFFFDDTWTTELEDSWMAALGMIAETMCSAVSVSVTPVKITQQKSAETSMKEEIERVLKELMRESILELVTNGDIKDLANIQARSLIKDSLQQQLQELREKFKSRKAA